VGIEGRWHARELKMPELSSRRQVVRVSVGRCDELVLLSSLTNRTSRERGANVTDTDASQEIAAPSPQPVLASLTTSAIFLSLCVSEGAENKVRDLLADLSGLQRTVGFRVPEAHLSVVAGIGAAAWDRLFSGPRPRDLHEFREVRGEKHVAPSTPGDVIFHIRAQQMDLCFELATLIMERLRGSVVVVDETHGFKYFDERDLLGFVDGTENPVGRAATDAAIIGADDPYFSGSSYVIVQKYLHQLGAWNALSDEEQAMVVGRTKLANVELSDEVKPSNSHVALNTIIDEQGVEHDIVRDNMPFGSAGVGEFGTYFIGYARTPAVTELMLQRMFVGNPPGNYDRILDFSTAITGTLYFVPTADFLDDPPTAPSRKF
jgi:putative iron-dependent peroxidase